MTLRETTSVVATAGESSIRADMFRIEILKKRGDFLKAARSFRVVTPAFTLQIRRRNDNDSAVRVGFTCSKKVGNAVARNRAKRRLREIARLALPEVATPGADYVLIGRAETTAKRPFDLMLADLKSALEKRP